MIKDFKSSLGEQIQVVSGGTIQDYLSTQVDYACKENTNIHASKKRSKLGFLEEKVTALKELFESSIDPSTFEHAVVAGEDTGLGLFSFGDFKKDPKTGLYLTYREYALPILGFQADFYIGAFQNPGNYDDLVKKGVKEVIAVTPSGFVVEKSSGKGPVAKCLDGLWSRLRENPRISQFKFDDRREK